MYILSSTNYNDMEVYKWFFKNSSQWTKEILNCNIKKIVIICNFFFIIRMLNWYVFNF